MAQIWFIKSTYNGNAFKVSEFFNADGTYKKNVGSNLEVDMPFNDGISLIDAIHHKTTNGTHIRDYTHFIVPDKNKVYRINKIDELNHDTLRMEVADEPWIGEYWNYKDKNMNITRSNDFSTYIGVNDISDLTTGVDSNIVNMRNIKTRSNLWQLVYIQVPTEAQIADSDKVEIAIRYSSSDGNIHNKYDDLASAKIDYPSLKFNNKEELNEYAKNSLKFGNRIVVGNSIYEYNITPNNYTDGGYNWIELLRPGRDTSTRYIYIDTSYFTSMSISTFPDVDSIILALPLSIVLQSSSSSSPGSPTYYVNSSNFKDISLVTGAVGDRTYDVTKRTPMSITSIKIVPEDLLFSEGTMVTSAQNRFENLTTLDLTTHNPGLPESSVYIVKYINPNITLKYNKQINNIILTEPFTTYSLYISGEETPIPSFRLKDLYLKNSLNSLGINYSIYLDSDLKKLIMSSTISNSARWSKDSYSEWVASNPTYKEQYMARKQIDWTNNLVGAGNNILGGAAAGFLMGGGPAGALMGAGAGLLNTATSYVSTGIRHSQQDKLYELEDRARRLQSDKIMGDANSGGLITMIRQNIYIIEKTSNKQEEMLIEYYKVGHPTNKYKTLDSLSWQPANTLYPKNKVVSGYLLNTVRNNYTTDMINFKLSDGVIIVE